MPVGTRYLFLVQWTIIECLTDPCLQAVKNRMRREGMGIEYVWLTL